MRRTYAQQRILKDAGAIWIPDYHWWIVLRNGTVNKLESVTGDQYRWVEIDNPRLRTELIKLYKQYRERQNAPSNKHTR